MPYNKILFPHHVSTECRVLSTDLFHLSGCISGWINKKSFVKIASTIYCTKLLIPSSFGGSHPLTFSREDGYIQKKFILALELLYQKMLFSEQSPLGAYLQAQQTCVHLDVENKLTDIPSSVHYSLVQY